MKGLAALVALLWTLSVCAFEQNGLSRRAFVQVAAGTTAATLLGPSVQQPAFAAAPATLVEELKSSKIKMEPIPELLEQKEWDKVRSILKLPPVNKLWNLGDVSVTMKSVLGFVWSQSCLVLTLVIVSKHDSTNRQRDWQRRSL